ncbi:uncharacterized protein KY384_009265 [Bacidia gigantensis]|uniref:uncharacterized protein n=1 Tax=Bacidia gigantensis TaxID=2732470 RepID=UPI001D05C1C5|nr:uncharacterized protein KY384_009265 [Bacidia gigantensis]KAG8525621.1 hypothetical protein KY384_009265 [Bacidia gigantensis]
MESKVASFRKELKAFRSRGEAAQVSRHLDQELLNNLIVEHERQGEEITRLGREHEELETWVNILEIESSGLKEQIENLKDELVGSEEAEKENAHEIQKLRGEAGGHLRLNREPDNRTTGKYTAVLLNVNADAFKTAEACLQAMVATMPSSCASSKLSMGVGT